MPGLMRFEVTVRVFDPAASLASGTDVVLPVHSPDANHVAASTLANAISWTAKIGEDGNVLPVAFACVAVAERGPA